MTRESGEGKLRKKTSVCRHQARERNCFPAKEVGDSSRTTVAEKAPGTPADPKCGHLADADREQFCPSPEAGLLPSSEGSAKRKGHSLWGN